MKKIKSPFLILYLSILLAPSCKKDYTVVPLFSGITVTDINAQPTGFVDTTDWNLTDTWANFELALFPGIANLANLCAVDPTYNLPIAFPNPCTRLGNIGFNIPASSLISLRVIDLSLNTIYVLDNLAPDSGGYANTTIDFSQLGVSNEIVRVYYVITDSTKNCVYKGHGDILVQ